MPHLNLDTAVFGLYLLAVFAVGIVVSRKEKQWDDYFLAGRQLTWWVIGGSLIAANISTHHFIGMSGQGYTIGLAIASYEWIAAIALILYGKFFLPYYLKTRITTMPEFLENRFNQRVRLVFAIISLIGYIFIELAVVLYTGSLAIQSIFGLPLVWGLAVLCLVGGGYTIYGGLKSVVYTDVIQVTLLIVGGLVVTFVGLGIPAGVSDPRRDRLPFLCRDHLVVSHPRTLQPEAGHHRPFLFNRGPGPDEVHSVVAVLRTLSADPGGRPGDPV